VRACVRACTVGCVNERARVSARVCARAWVRARVHARVCACAYRSVTGPPAWLPCPSRRQTSRRSLRFSANMQRCNMENQTRSHATRSRTSCCALHVTTSALPRWWWSNRSFAASYTPPTSITMSSRSKTCRSVQRVALRCNVVTLSNGLRYDARCNMLSYVVATCRAAMQRVVLRCNVMCFIATQSAASQCAALCRNVFLCAAACCNVSCCIATTTGRLSTSLSRERTILAFAKSGCCRSSQHPSASSHWNVPECVPITCAVRH
jgi:hypothetical protein